jgi:starvation-inducible DNA-binding protein
MRSIPSEAPWRGEYIEDLIPVGPIWGLQTSPRKGVTSTDAVVGLSQADRHSNFSKEGIPMAKTDSEKSELRRRRETPLITPTDLGAKASADIAGGMNAILADVFALYMKTKNFHWHMSGPHFRDYHLLLDEQADQLYAMTDPIAERIRKTGGSTLRSIGHIARIQRIKDNDADYVDPLDMLAELREDNQTLAARLREVHDVVDEVRDIATASLIENWIDETERRTWFLFESSRRGE